MKTKITILAVLAAILLLPAVRAEDDSENIWEKRVAATADSIVFLKFVLKIQMTRGAESQEFERTREVQGIVVNDQGLIMSSNAHFDPARTATLPPNLRGQVKIEATPTDMKVLFGNGEEEYEAQIVARDSVLDLAFVQILDLKGKQVKPIDLTAGVEPKLGQELYGIARMPRGFDCVPVVVRLFISASITKPRKMWSASGELPAPSLPVFNHDGVPAGIVSLQQASAGVEGGGGRSRPFLLPLADVVKSCEMAAKRAAETLEEAQGDDDDDDDGEAGESEETDEADEAGEGE